MFAPIAEFRSRLKAGEVLLGTAIALTDPFSSESLADSVDFLWIDQEHTPMSPEALRAHLTALRGRGKPGLVRVTEGSTPFIKPVLDAGASGVVAPQVKSAEEVRRVVADCRYTPEGSRGFGPMVPSNFGRVGGQAYIDEANANVFAAVMLETVEAVKEIDEIVAIPGLDSIVIGPQDLSASLGVPGDTEHPRVVGAMEEVIGKAREAGIFVGAGLGIDAEYALVLARRGVQWLQIGADVMFLVNGMDAITSDIRSGLADGAR